MLPPKIPQQQLVRCALLSLHRLSAAERRARIARSALTGSRTRRSLPKVRRRPSPAILRLRPETTRSLRSEAIKQPQPSLQPKPTIPRSPAITPPRHPTPKQSPSLRLRRCPVQAQGLQQSSKEPQRSDRSDRFLPASRHLSIFPRACGRRSFALGPSPPFTKAWGLWSRAQIL